MTTVAKVILSRRSIRSFLAISIKSKLIKVVYEKWLITSYFYAIKVNNKDLIIMKTFSKLRHENIF